MEKYLLILTSTAILVLVGRFPVAVFVFCLIPADLSTL